MEESGSMADTLCVSRSERMVEVSQRVRDESTKVNAEFAAIERDPGEPRA